MTGKKRSKDGAKASQGDDLYTGFVERYFDTDDANLPADWPEEVKKRCLFFLKTMEASSSITNERSVLATLSSSGIESRLSNLEGVDEKLFEESDERYRVEKEIARGGMGRILLAYDRDLRRRIAIKVLRSATENVARASRFLEEAQATAQLEHPNIGPVYDLGVGPSEKPYFTMKWIRGRNLEEVLDSSDAAFSLIRLLQTLQQAAMGVDFAHSRGVIHRDLKPQNIMVGDYGEVLVVDWGLAKILGHDDESDAERVSTARKERGVRTLDGAVQGSVQYMAPEQARGETRDIDRTTDVFGLGAILYRVLTGTPLYTGDSFESILESARRASVIPPAECAPSVNIPPELETICLKAISGKKANRFQNARELHEALQAYIEGIHDAERRAAEAARLIDIARGRQEELEAAELSEADLAARIEELEARIADHESAEKKAPLWKLLEAAQALRRDIGRLFDETTTAYHAVLSIDPAHSAAREALSDLFYRRMLAAERRDDVETARLYESFVARYDDGRYRVELADHVPLVIDSEPRGATVTVSRYEERGLVLVAEDPEALGVTPLETTLPRGSYLAVVKKSGFAEARYPFVVDRRGRHDASVRLFADGVIPDGFVQITAGESIVGGDPKLSALKQTRRVVGDFFIARYPVTLEEYCEYLNACHADADEKEIADFVPFFGKEHYALRGEDGRFRPAERLPANTPVLSLPPRAMLAYCDWLAQKLKRAIRLPRELEWERAARGADGRLYPWGHHFDWALMKGARSRDGEPFPEPVGTFSDDCSPFGVRDLAGCVREMCDGRTQDGYRIYRGGSWFNANAMVFRAIHRSFHRDGAKSTDIGFRVCYNEIERAGL